MHDANRVVAAPENLGSASHTKMNSLAIILALCCGFCSCVSQAGTLAQQAITNIRTVTAYNGQDAVLSEYSKALDATIKSGIKTGGIIGFSLGGFTCLRPSQLPQVHAGGDVPCG